MIVLLRLWVCQSSKRYVYNVIGGVLMLWYDVVRLLTDGLVHYLVSAIV